MSNLRADAIADSTISGWELPLPLDGNKDSLPGLFVSVDCIKVDRHFAIIAWTFWISFPAPASAATRLAIDSGTFVSTVPRPAPPVRRQRVRSTGDASRPRAASSSVASDRRRPHARRGRRGRVPRGCSGGWGHRARRSSGLRNTCARGNGRAIPGRTCCPRWLRQSASPRRSRGGHGRPPRRWRLDGRGVTHVHRQDQPAASPRLDVAPRGFQPVAAPRHQTNRRSQFSKGLRRGSTDTG